jgi:hypothetical protein
MRLHIQNEELTYEGIFDFDYDRYGKSKHVTFEHNLILDLKTGDIVVIYRIKNNLGTDEKMFRNSNNEKKNNFKLLFDLIDLY